MVNEFSRITLQCDSTYVVPNGAGYSQTVQNDNQVCSLQGATAGQNAIPGLNYLYTGFQYEYVSLARQLQLPQY